MIFQQNIHDLSQMLQVKLQQTNLFMNLDELVSFLCSVHSFIFQLHLLAPAEGSAGIQFESVSPVLFPVFLCL